MERLRTSPRGLSSEEVESGRALYGPNEVVREKKLAAFRQFIGQFKNPLIIILLFAAVLSIFLGEFVDALIIIAIVFISVFVDFFQEYRAERTVEPLKEKISTTGHRNPGRNPAGRALIGTCSRGYHHPFCG